MLPRNVFFYVVCLYSVRRIQQEFRVKKISVNAFNVRVWKNAVKRIIQPKLFGNFSFCSVELQIYITVIKRLYEIRKRYPLSSKTVPLLTMGYVRYGSSAAFTWTGISCNTWQRLWTRVALFLEASNHILSISYNSFKSGFMFSFCFNSNSLSKKVG